MFDTAVSDIQENISVENGEITGTSKWLAAGAIVTEWGEGNFIALDWGTPDPDAVSCKVGLEPSAGSGLVEVINDPDHNGVFKITNKATQKFVIIQTAANGQFNKQTFGLSGLTMEEET